MKKLTIIFLAFIIIFPAFAMGTSQEENSNEATNNQIENSYNFTFTPSQNSDSSPAKAEIVGNNCDDLKGGLYSLDGKFIWYEGSFYCLPEIKDVHEFLQNASIISINYEGIFFKDGPSLLSKDWDPNKFSKRSDPKKLLEQSAVKARDEEAFAQKIKTGVYKNVPDNIKWVIQGGASNGEFYKVKSIEECGTQDNVFCAIIDNYSYVPAKIDMTYYVYCWDCKNLKSSPEKLQEEILFFQNGKGLALNGGFAFTDTSASKFLTNLQTIQP